MNVMLLAAGEGTRLRPYTAVLPKPAIPFLTVPLAGHALSFLHDIFIDKLVVNTFHLPQKIHELFHSLPHGAKNIYFSDEVGKILGSGGGLGNARKHFLGGGDFFMMNADEVILPRDSFIANKAFEAHKRSKAIATLLVMDHPGVGSQFGGVWTDAAHRVLGFGKTPIPGSVKGWHFVGVQILSERVFKYIPASGESNILYDALTTALQNGDLVQAFPFECTWFETGNPQDFLSASEKCFQFLAQKENSYQKASLQRTLSHFAFEKVHVKEQGAAKLLLADSVMVDSSASLAGLVVAGSRAIIGAQTRLKNVIIANGVEVSPDTVASDTLLL